MAGYEPLCSLEILITIYFMYSLLKDMFYYHTPCFLPDIFSFLSLILCIQRPQFALFHTSRSVIFYATNEMATKGVLVFVSLCHATQHFHTVSIISAMISQNILLCLCISVRQVFFILICHRETLNSFRSN